MDTEQTQRRPSRALRRNGRSRGDIALPRMAVRGDEYDTSQTGRTSADGMANFIGWFSIGLGVAEVVAPGAVARLIGADDTDRVRDVTRAMGLREISNGVAVLANPRPEKAMWSRVAGDVLDLSLLGAVLADGENDRSRTIGAALAVLGVTALDFYCARQLASIDEDAVAVAHEPGIFTKRSITINQPVDAVSIAWREWRAQEPVDAYEGAEVRFAEAPGGRGTEVRVDLRYDPPGGVLGSKVMMLWRKEPGQRLQDDLRRFKQMCEIGELTVSDATYRRGMHPAQPPMEVDA